MLIDYIIGPKARAATRWLSSTADTKEALPKATSAEGEALNVGLERVAFWWSMAPRAWATGLLCELAARISCGPRSGLPIRGDDLRTSVMTATVGALVLSVGALLVSYRVLHLRKQIIDRLAESSAAELKARSRELLESIMKGVYEAVGVGGGSGAQRTEAKEEHESLRRGDMAQDLVTGEVLMFYEVAFVTPGGGAGLVFTTKEGGQVLLQVSRGESIWSKVRRFGAPRAGMASRKGAAS